MAQKSGLVRKELPQVAGVKVLVQGYKEPILAVNHGGYGWYGLMAYSDDGEEKPMCHECGRFFDSLGQHVANKHRLTPMAYKEKYGLLSKVKLASRNFSLRMAATQRQKMKNPVFRAKAISNLNLYTGNKLRNGGIHGRKKVQYQNQMDTCQGQILRCLIDASKVYGKDVSAIEAEVFRPGLCLLLQKRFGSYNKAKQLAGLTVNKHGRHTSFPEQLILEDMVIFYRRNNYWPREVDYEKRLLICSYSPIFRNGGILFLREKAVKLYEEQESRAMVHETVSKIAERINFENAAYARR